MASYHCSVKVGGKGQARSHAAYIAREGSYAERAGYEDLEATGHTGNGIAVASKRYGFPDGILHIL